MTTSQPTPPQAAPANYWQVPSSSGNDHEIVPWLRARLVALVAALLVQATIAALGVLPELPVVNDIQRTSYEAYSQPAMFWVQFAVLEFLAAVVIAVGFGPGVRLGDLPAIARVVLALAFVVLPVAAIVIGGLNAARAAAGYSNPYAVASSWLTTTAFGILFFGLPLVALIAPGGRGTTKSAA